MSGKKRNVMLFVLLFTLLLGVIVPVQAQSDGRTKIIRVAYREDADFINKSSSGVYKGYGVEYLNKISHAMRRKQRPGRRIMISPVCLLAQSRRCCIHLRIMKIFIFRIMSI